MNKIKISITNSNSNIKDISNSIIHIYDNYDEQLLCLHKLLNGTDFDEKKYFIQALKTKLDSYKQQDKKKAYDDYDNFITLENIIDKLVAYNMKCYYCACETYLLYEIVREMKQWSLDRINNEIGHNKGNLIICCLECNLKRRRTNKDAFFFTKNLKITKKNHYQDEIVNEIV